MKEKLEQIDEAIKDAEDDKRDAICIGDYHRVNGIELYLKVLRYIKETIEKGGE
jgi:hypothetical protein